MKIDKNLTCHIKVNKDDTTIIFRRNNKVISRNVQKHDRQLTDKEVCELTDYFYKLFSCLDGTKVIRIYT